jgi:hypothetical protein
MIRRGNSQVNISPDSRGTTLKGPPSEPKKISKHSWPSNVDLTWINSKALRSTNKNNILISLSELAG